MTFKLFLTILSLNLTLTIFSQPDLLNQFDTNRKKDGKWIVYLNKNWKKLNDSTKAVFIRYTYYDHGTNIYPMGECGGKDYRLEGSDKKLLNGEYKWYDAKGNLSSVHVLKNGEYISCKEYYSSGELSQHFDYSKKREGQLHGWTVYAYDKKGNLTLTSSTCRDKEGHWPVMRD